MLTRVALGAVPAILPGPGTGDTTGPAGATDGHIAIFDGVTGKFIRDSGVPIFPTELDDGNSGAAKTINWTTARAHKLTLTASCTLTLTAPPAAGELILHLVQDGVGGHTLTWPASVKWAGGTAPVLSVAAAAIDIVRLYWDGTSYFGTGFFKTFA